jgi:hypothetical protein
MMALATLRHSKSGVASRSVRRGAAAVAFSVVAAVFTLGVLVQVFLAGMGVFGAHGAAIQQADSLDAHRTWGNALGVQRSSFYCWACSPAPRGGWSRRRSRSPCSRKSLSTGSPKLARLTVGPADCTPATAR